MPEALGPLLLPPTPPEASSIAQSFPHPLRGWMERMVDWVAQLVRVLKDTWIKLIAQLNSIIASVALVQAAVTVLQARVKDIYTFSASGPVVLGALSLPLRVVAASTMLEGLAAVEVAPTGSSLLVEMRRNGVSMATLTIAAGAFSGTVTGLTQALTKDTDKLTAHVTQVGSTTPGEDLVVQMRAA